MRALRLARTLRGVRIIRVFRYFSVPRRFLVSWFRGRVNSVAAKSRRCESGLERIDLIDFQYHGLIAAAWLARFLPELLEVTGSCGATWSFFCTSWMHRFCWVERYVTVRYIYIYIHHSELTLVEIFFGGWHVASRKTHQ